MTERPSDADDPTKRDRYLKRRRFLAAAGSVGAAGLLAGCQAQEGPGQAENNTTATTATTVNTTATTAETETPTTTTEPGSLQERYPGLRILSPEPENAEAAERATYTTMITPIQEFYIRNHYPTPSIDEGDWSISLTGAFDQTTDLSVETLKSEFPRTTVFHALQCSGNGRSYFVPQVGGNQWSFGAVGNAEWTGVPVSAVLQRYGADTADGMWASFMGGEAPEGEDIFTRSIPMQKAMDDCILAYEMNGEPLPSDHGFPVRLVVPGWYGNNNVKWVNRIHVMDMMVFGDQWEESADQRTYTHWQQYSYRIIPEEDDAAEQYQSIDVFDTQDQMDAPDQIRNAYVYDQLVKSLIGFPGEGSTVSTGPSGTIEVVGVAWAGDDNVDAVEISTDAGETWEQAEFLEPNLGTFSWRLFRYVWEPDSGEYTLYSRATDDQGRTQPATVSDPSENLRGIQDDQFPWNQDGYCNTAYEPHGVDVTVQ